VLAIHSYIKESLPVGIATVWATRAMAMMLKTFMIDGVVALVKSAVERW